MAKSKSKSERSFKTQAIFRLIGTWRKDYEARGKSMVNSGVPECFNCTLTKRGLKPPFLKNRM